MLARHTVLEDITNVVLSDDFQRAKDDFADTHVIAQYDGDRGTEAGTWWVGSGPPFRLLLLQ